MKFYSTNGQSRNVSLEEVVMTGLAPDGGLFLPERFPVIPRAFFNNMGEMTVRDIAYVVANTMLGEDIDSAELREIVNDTFTFDIPLRHIHDNVYSLELYHGPTLAFKDVGARFLARIISHYSKKMTGEINVLVAPSGDSGGAVASGFHKVPGVNVYVLYPERVLSAMQKHQFVSLGDNIHPIEVLGNFDDCQRIAKEAFNDLDLRARMHLTSANSINVCRMIPQMFYYFYGYADLLRQNPDVHDVVVAVPSGNLGNLTAGLSAKIMGLPIKRFVAANNRNDVFTQYLATGSFTPRQSVRTLACAMDVGNPSNFSRILEMYHHDHTAMCADINGYTLTDREIADTMVDVHSIHNYLLDPHGATAYKALEMDLRDGETGIFLETAHPSKFAKTMREVTGVEFPEPKTATPQRIHPNEIQRISPSHAALKKILLNAT